MNPLLFAEEPLLRLRAAPLALDSPPLCVAFSPDSRHLLAVSQNLRVVRWDAVTGDERDRSQLPPTRTVRRVVFAPDGTAVAVASFTDGVAVHDLHTTQRIANRSLAAYGTHHLAWGFGRPIAVGSPDGQLSLWEPTGDRRTNLKAHDRGLVSVEWSGDGQRLATAALGERRPVVRDPDGQPIREMDQPTGKEPFVCRGPLAFAPDGRWLAQAGGVRVPVWDVETGKVLLYLEPPAGAGASSALAFAPDGRTLAVAWADRTVRLVAIPSGEPVRTIAAAGFLTQLTYSPNGRFLAGAGLTVRLWDAGDGRDLFPPSGHAVAVSGFAFLDGGRTLVSLDRAGEVCAWELPTGRLVARLERQPQAIAAVARSPDGRSALLAGARPELGVWRPGRPVVWTTLTGAGEPARPRFAEGGRVLAMRADRAGVQLFGADGRAGQLVRGPDPAVRRIALSADGRRLVACDPVRPTLDVWDATTGQIGSPIRIGEGTRSGIEVLAVSPDSRTVAVVDLDEVTHIREIATGYVRAAWPQPLEGGVLSLTFDPTGRFLLAATVAGTVRVYDSATDRGVRLDCGRGIVSSVATSPDGSRIVAGQADGSIAVWDATRLLAPIRKETAGRDRLVAWWHDLGSRDGWRAHAAIHGLAGDPAAVELIRDRLTGTGAVDAAKIAGWIRDLDADRHAVREQAQRALADLGSDVRNALRTARAITTSAEVRRRIDQLLATAGTGLPLARMRGWRALEVLERIGTPEARAVIERLASGPAEAPLTAEARTTRDRLAER